MQYQSHYLEIYPFLRLLNPFFLRACLINKILSTFLSKCHQHALESMQASMEAEAKAKAEALRMKKKLESDINELEIALDHSNKANADLQKHLKKVQAEMKDLQVRLEEEHRLASDFQEQLGISERRAHALNAELEESRGLLEQSDRARRQTEAELAEANEQVSQLTNQNGSLTIAKRKIENEMQTLQVSISLVLSIQLRQWLGSHKREYHSGETSFTES